MYTANTHTRGLYVHWCLYVSPLLAESRYSFSCARPRERSSFTGEPRRSMLRSVSPPVICSEARCASLGAMARLQPSK